MVGSVGGCRVPKTPRQRWRELVGSWERSRHIEVPPPVAAAPPEPGGLRIAFLIYRGNPRCGGQGVYTRHLTRELVALGHSVEVFAGQPWPDLDEGVGLHPGPGPRPVPRPGPLPGPHPREFTSTERPDRVRRHVRRRASASRSPTRAGSARCWPAARASSTSSTTTSASATGCSGMRRGRLAAARRPCTTRSPSTAQLALDHTDQPLAALHDAALVRLPADAGAGGAPAARPS